MGSRGMSSKAGGGNIQTTIKNAQKDAIQKLEAKGNKVEDKYIIPDNNAIIALVKSNIGNYSIRQSFYSKARERYQDFSVIKSLRNKGQSAAKLEFDDMIYSIKNR